VRLVLPAPEGMGERARLLFVEPTLEPGLSIYHDDRGYAGCSQGPSSRASEGVNGVRLRGFGEKWKAGCIDDAADRRVIGIDLVEWGRRRRQ
jgi:hypothetical protein